MSAKMESLTSLDLSSCYLIKKIPEFKGTMKSLSKLSLRLTAIKELPPSSIEGLTALEILDLSYCSNLKCLPSNMDSLRSLKFLNLSECSKLEEIELNGIGCLSSLRYLLLSSNNFVTLPATFSQLSKLEDLNLSHCKMLRSVPELSSTMRYINMERCRSLEPSPSFCGYDESSKGVIGVAFTILNRYLQVISSFSLFDSFSSLVKWNIIFFFFFGYRDSFVKKLDMKMLPKEKRMDLKLNFWSLFPEVLFHGG